MASASASTASPHAAGKLVNSFKELPGCEPVPVVTKATQVSDGPGLVQSQTPPAPGNDSGPDDLTCAVCLEQTEPAEIAVVKGCDHTYCVKCILRWTLQSEPARCPQCKSEFSYLLTYRSLDGTLHDFPSEESVVLLKRARWFLDAVAELEKGKGVAGDPGTGSLADDWDDYGRYYEEYDDDDEVEAFYFSSAAGRARVTIGNRRWGENGYVASGRQQARPIVRAKGKAGAGKVADGGGSSATPNARMGTPNSGVSRRSRSRNASAASRSPASTATATPAAPSTVAAGSSTGASASVSSASAIPAGGVSGDKGVGRASTPIAIAKQPTPSPSGYASGASPGSGTPYGSWSDNGVQGSGSGRRARRNARRNALDGITGASPP